MTKITEDLLFERGFKSISDPIISNYRLILTDNRQIDISPYEIKYVPTWCLCIGEYYSVIEITNNLQYIEDLDKFISICNL